MEGRSQELQELSEVLRLYPEFLALPLVSGGMLSPLNVRAACDSQPSGHGEISGIRSRPLQISALSHLL